MQRVRAYLSSGTMLAVLAACTAFMVPVSAQEPPNMPTPTQVMSLSLAS